MYEKAATDIAVPRPNRHLSDRVDYAADEIRWTSFLMGDALVGVDRNTDFTLHGGYVARLSGWTHARAYAHGLLRNIPGDATATVSGLSPNEPYEYAIYQFATSHFGANGFQVNGVT